MPTSCHPQMVHEYYVGRVREVMRRRQERLAALRTRADAEAYVRDVRRKVRRCFGPLPRRTPLEAVVTGRDTYPGYTLEKVLFESRPGFLVTGNLYLPEPRSGKCPGVLGVCGHSVVGKAEPYYQSFCQGLARKGFVVFVIDPVCQGERRQYYDDDGGPRPELCAAHNLIGNQMSLIGDFLGTWRVWDAIRGLDYLLTRPEVDRRRVGVTGNSGGGTLSTWLTALDPRLTMAAPSCFVCSFLANVENELPSDSEQNPPGCLAAGLDQADLLLAYAPRPTLVLSQYDDFFDERAARVAAQEVRRVHELLGSHDSAEYFMGPRSHGFHIENREAMYAFFLKHTGLTAPAPEGEVAPVAPERLFATPDGQTRMGGSRRVFDFTADAAQAISRQRPRLAPEALRQCARKVLGIPNVKGPPHFRLQSPHGALADLSLRARFAVETEPGILALVHSFGPPHPATHPPAGQVLLYVGHTCSIEDVRDLPELRALTQGQRPLLTVDPRGIGPSQAGTCGSTAFFESYGADFLYASTADMLGESYLGRRVLDVLRTMDFALAGGATEVELIGRGLGSITAAFAALLHPAAPRVRLINFLPGFELLTQSPRFVWPLSALPRGVLRHFDLPDVYRVLGDRLTREQPWTPMMIPVLAPPPA